MHRRWIPFFGLLVLVGAAHGLDPRAGDPWFPVNAIPAFPGAEGFGAFTPGGRRGAVLLVTNLNDTGPGSLREAVETPGPRTVIFKVSGTIRLESPLIIAHPYITIAGQSAPGDGICIAGETVAINTHDVVLRHLRIRRGSLVRADDALGGHPVRNVIVDHCSISWGLDENLSIYRHVEEAADGFRVKLPVENVTIQWTISSEALNARNHAFGGTWGGRNVSLHHNLFASNTGRNPSLGWADRVDFRNNVIFNWRHRTLDGGDASSLVNVVGNYYKPGPATLDGPVRYRIARPQHLDMHTRWPGGWYVAGNVVEGFPEVSADNWNGGVQFDGVSSPEELEALIRRVRLAEPIPVAPVTQQSAEEAYRLVLQYVGAILPKRDAVDRRIVESVRTGKPSAGNGIINHPLEVGGWPELKSAPPPEDRDQDGMPDGWEQRYGLDPESPQDHREDPDEDGYTNLEEWLNGTDPTQFVDYTDPKNNVDPLLR